VEACRIITIHRRVSFILPVLAIDGNCSALDCGKVVCEGVAVVQLDIAVLVCGILAV